MQEELILLAEMENVIEGPSEQSVNIQQPIQFNEAPEKLPHYEQIEPNRTGKIIGIILLLLFVAANTISIIFFDLYYPRRFLSLKLI